MGLDGIVSWLKRALNRQAAQRKESSKWNARSGATRVACDELRAVGYLKDDNESAMRDAVAARVKGVRAIREW